MPSFAVLLLLLALTVLDATFGLYVVVAVLLCKAVGFLLGPRGAILNPPLREPRPFGKRPNRDLSKCGDSWLPVKAVGRKVSSRYREGSR